MQKWGAAGQYGYKLERLADETVRLSISSDGTTVISVTSAATVSEGAWYWIVGRFDPGTELAVLVDGTWQKNTTGIPAAVFNSTAVFQIGAMVSDMRVSLQFLSAMMVGDAILAALAGQVRDVTGL